MYRAAESAHGYGEWFVKSGELALSQVSKGVESDYTCLAYANRSYELLNNAFPHFSFYYSQMGNTKDEEFSSTMPTVLRNDEKGLI